jgi:hypothetical protein
MAPSKKKGKSFLVKAFEIILIESLSIHPDNNQPLTVIYDDDFLNMFNSLLQVVTDWNIPTTFIFIPKNYQAMMIDNKRFFDENNEINLPPQILGAVQNSNLILNFLNGESKFSKIRGAIISLRKQFSCKMVHSPGISEDVLKITIKSPFKRIHKESELVAWALGNASFGKIITNDKLGNEYALAFNIDGWENEPFMSSGKIFDDSWGNIPPGESFCCPDVTSVNGQICVNGSTPGYLLTPSEEIMLDFKNGKLKEWSASGDNGTIYFTELEKDAIKRGDKNWNSFAEFGIGLNPAIKKLVGQSLFDEKMAGTIHIALGDNTSFGHGVSSFYHDDLICLKPSVQLDDHLIMSKGNLNLEIIKKWKRSISFNSISIQDKDIIIFHSKRLLLDSNFMYRILSKGDRKGKILISNGKFKNLFLKFKSAFNEREDFRYMDLKRRFKKNELMLLDKMLLFFFHYKVININTNEK